MKKILTISLWAVMVFVLASCDFVITGSVDIGLPPGFSVSNATYETNYQATIDGRNRFVICENKTTQLSYSFDYSGTLESWSSYLQGVTTGSIRGERTFSQANITTPGLVQVSYTITPNATPLATGVSPNAIIVVPKPVIIGYTKLYLNVNGYNRAHPLTSESIPVIEPCS